MPLRVSDLVGGDNRLVEERIGEELERVFGDLDAGIIVMKRGSHGL